MKKKESEAPAFTANGLPIDRSIKIVKSKAAKREEVKRIAEQLRSWLE